MDKAFKIILAFLLCKAKGFEDIKIGNKTYSGWHKYKYFDNTARNFPELNRTYVMTEVNPRAYLMCPKGFAIDNLSSAFFLQKSKIWTAAQNYHREEYK